MERFVIIDEDGESSRKSVECTSVRESRSNILELPELQHISNSRDGDMHLHTHMVSVNSTGGPDDDWRSLPHIEFVTLLFDSHIAAHEIAWMLCGNWDGCNGVSLNSLDEEAVDVAAKLHQASWCKTGDSCPITDLWLISQEAWEALLEDLANYF